MRIEKLPSGSYRVRQQSQGKRYSIVFDHKPTAKEINKALADAMAVEGANYALKGSVDSYANKYLDECRNSGKSPTTIKGYQSIKNNTPNWFLDKNLHQITAEDIQALVDEYGANHSPKSTRSLHSLYHSILAIYHPQFTYSIKLPLTTKKHEYEPSTKDIKAILEYTKDSRYYLVLRLLCIGLRRGEACAITSKDLDKNNVLTIDKVLIVDENNEQVIKNSPKTDASFRRILIPEDIADLIRKKENVFEGNMHTINEYLHKVQKDLDIPKFRLHILRHFAAAYMLKNKFSVVEIEDYMGWEHGSSTMQKVYAYNLDPEDSQKDIAKAFSGLV